jgi:VanZ family protein
MLMTKNSIFLFRLSLVLALIVITYLTTTSVEYSVAEQVSDKLSHALAFLGLSLLADFSFPASRFSWQKIVPLFSYGVLLECIQYFLPYRNFSLLDMLADAAGIGIYILLVPLLRYLPVLQKRWSEE